MNRSFILSSQVLLLACLLFTTGGRAQAELPDNLDGIVDGLRSDYGGSWGIGVMDLETGESEFSGGNRQFSMAVPHLPMTACGIELSNDGIMPLDSLIARNEQFWEKLHWSQQGGRGTCQSVLYAMGEERIGNWLESRGFSGTVVKGVQLDFPDCPQVDPNYITAGDALEFLRIIYDNLEVPYVAEMGSNPPLSDHNRETLSLGNDIYGWIDQSSQSRHLFIIVDRPRGSDYGIVVLAEGVGDPSDVDGGFRTVYNALVH